MDIVKNTQSKEEKNPKDKQIKKVTKKTVKKVAKKPATKTKANPRGAGRHKVNLDEPLFTGWDQLNQLILWGSLDFCSEQLSVSPSTLGRLIKERYGVNFDEYRHKRREAIRINLSRKQYEVAMGGNTAMLIWLGKQYLGQSEKIEKKQENSFVDESGQSLIRVEFIGDDDKD